MNTVRIILVDDHNIVRRALATLLQTDPRYLVVGEADNGEDALNCIEKIPADLVVMDLSMPRMNGFEAIRRISKKKTDLSIMVLSMYDDVQFIAEALNCGARGYILKQSLDEELFLAMETLLSGNQYVSQTIDMARVHEHMLVTQDLTAREREVLQLIAEGYTTQELAEVLHISPHTATRHRANLMQKLNVHNQMELVRVATQKGLIIIN